MLTVHGLNTDSHSQTKLGRPGFTGPLSAPMWKRVQSLDSNYPDDFDYGVYDRLAERYSENPPRGGVIFGGGPKLLEAPDCSKCFHRFELDTYGRGCVHNCAYCYAKAYLSTRKYWNEPIPFPIDISEIRKIFATVFESDRPHRLRNVMARRIPLRLGSMSDCFMWQDKKYKVTLELLKILKFYRYPYIVFTRSDLVAENDYVAEMDTRLANIQMSISSINEDLTRKIEPGAPSPSRRLAALQKLSRAGFWTTVRINPLFPIFPDGYFSNPNFLDRENVKPFNFFSWDLIKAIADHNVPTLLVGVVRLYQSNLRFMSQALDYDIRSHFGTGTKMERAALHFSTEETAYYYQKIKSLCDQHGVRFSTCYIGGDAKGDGFSKFRHLWSNKKDCCDALGNVQAIRSTCANLNAPPNATRIDKPLRIDREIHAP